MTVRRTVAFLVLACWPALPSQAMDETAGISPGGADRILLESRCPTFSWTAVPGASRYELVVYEVSDETFTTTANLALSTVLPAGAFSWTPSRSQCFAGGATYAWTVRAVGESDAGAWSSERLFRAEAGLARREVAAAFEIVEEFLAGGGSFADLVGEPTTSGRAEMPAGQERAEPRRRVAGPVAVEETDRIAGLSAPLPVPLAKPFGALGLSSDYEGSPLDTGAAVRGVGNLDFGEEVAGYLGVTVGNLGAEDFDGFPQLGSLTGHEIGVLGFSNGGADNDGVVGVSEKGSGGWFFQVDGLGNPTNAVQLGTPAFAIDAAGPVRVEGSLTADSLVVSCPSGSRSIAAWCVGPEETGMNYRNARDNCWDQGKKLCPLDAILACDVQEPSGADCGVRTDDPVAEQWIWCAELEDDTNNDINPFASPTFAKARTFASVGNNEINEIDWLDQDLIYVSYCCSDR